ncbi:MAG: hypothetical protein AB7I38_06410 [Dehalococcoidia bacterium]
MNRTVRRTVHVFAALVVAFGIWAAGSALVAGQTAAAVGAAASAVVALGVWWSTGPPPR